MLRHLHFARVGARIELGLDPQPPGVAVEPINSTITSWLTQGRPRQFMLMWENKRCSQTDNVRIMAAAPKNAADSFVIPVFRLLDPRA